MITAVIITLNEERNIRRCIESVLPVVDEVLVIDSHSTDKTRDIAISLGAKALEVEWKGYSETKNFGHSKATHPYILSIDADEALSEVLQKSIIDAKQRGLKGAYSMNRMTNYCGSWIKHSGWYPDVKSRLFPREVQWEGDIHEELNLTDTSISHLEGDIYHYSYYDKKNHRERADKYSALTAKKMYEKGQTAGPLKPYLSAIGRFVGMYILKLGILDGKAGWDIARISAASNIFKYKELRRLNREHNADSN